MKKSLIALAALAAVGAASAQSSVTLYGRVDASLGQEKDTKAGTRGAVSLFNGNSGGLTGSRWGLRGTEDLGGGLKAEFKLENRFNVDTAATGSSTAFFGGDAYVALSSKDLGTVRLGRSYTAYDDIHAIQNSNNVFDSSFTPISDVTGGGGTVLSPNTGTSLKGIAANTAYAGRGTNQIKYISPNLMGATAYASYAFDENTGVKQQIPALGVAYANGPLTAGFGYQQEKNQTGSAADTGSKYSILSAAYDFGVAAVSAGYQVRNGATTGDKEFALGVNVPMGAIDLSAGLASGKTTNDADGATLQKASGFGLGATYKLSKRTKLYAGYKDTKGKDAAGVRTFGSRLYAAGVRHDF